MPEPALSQPRLPDLAWRHDPALAAVVAALGDVRYVGGAVRDALAGLPVTDIDLATPLAPDEVVRRLGAAGLGAAPTGIAHGTVTAIADHRGFEVTTLRRDVSTDGRRATVAFTDDWREDAARRDFTINALYADPASGALFDYLGGIDDLAARRLRFIGEAEQRIAEDHLRILRYYRFLARFGGPLEPAAPDPLARAACRAGATRLMALSRERVATELMKLLAAPDPVAAVSAMVEDGIFAAFLPELDDTAGPRIAALIAREEALAQPASPRARLLALLPPDADLVDNVAARLRFSRADRAALAARLAARTGMAAGEDPRALAYRHGLDAAREALLLFAGDEAAAALAGLRDFAVPRFPLTGRDVIARGLPPGPEVSQALIAIERIWVAEGFPGPERLAAIADQRTADTMKS